MNFDSLGMIETNGFVSALVALNKMLEIGNVEFLKKEVISNGQVSLFVMGNSDNISHSIQAGVIAAQSVGVVLASGIIPYPNNVIEKILFETETTKSKSKRVVKKSKQKEEEIVTLFDQLEEDNSIKEPNKVNDLKKRAINKVRKDEEFNAVSELFVEEKSLTNNNAKVLKKHDKNVDLVLVENEKRVKKAVLEKKEAVELEAKRKKIKEEAFNTASELLIEEKGQADSNIEILKIHDQNVDLTFDDEQIDIPLDNSEIINDEIDESVQDIELVADDLIELAPIVDSELEDEVVESDENVEKLEEENGELKSDENLTMEVVDVVEDDELESEPTLETNELESNEQSEFQGLSHLERLRAEAKAEIEHESDSSPSETDDELNVEDIKKEEMKIVEESVTEKPKNVDSGYLEEVSEMNVPDLRKLARSKENFPIKGREISKANRKLLLEYFSQI